MTHATDVDVTARTRNLSPAAKLRKNEQDNRNWTCAQALSSLKAGRRAQFGGSVLRDSLFSARPPGRGCPCGDPAPRPWIPVLPCRRHRLETSRLNDGWAAFGLNSLYEGGDGVNFDARVCIQRPSRHDRLEKRASARASPWESAWACVAAGEEAEG